MRLGVLDIGSNTVHLLLVDAHGHRALPRASKRVLARQLVNDIANRLPPVHT